jgi:hypothetical protein
MYANRFLFAIEKGIDGNGIELNEPPCPEGKA